MVFHTKIIIIETEHRNIEKVETKLIKNLICIYMFYRNMLKLFNFNFTNINK